MNNTYNTNFTYLTNSNVLIISDGSVNVYFNILQRSVGVRNHQWQRERCKIFYGLNYSKQMCSKGNARDVFFK